MTEPPPHDADTERGLLGWMIDKPSVIEEVQQTGIGADDFYQPRHASMYVLLSDLHRDGVTIDGEVVAAEVRRLKLPFDGNDLISMQREGTRNVRHAAQIITAHRVARRVLAAATEVAQIARNTTFGPDEMVERSMAALSAIDTPAFGAEHLVNYWTLPEYLALDRDKPVPWVIPGLLRMGWRCMVVAEEGAGKSILARQVGMAAAQGIHPFSFVPIPPVRTLLVDLENPRDVIQSSLRRMNEQAERAPDYDGDRWAIWEEPGGIDLRGRRDQHQFEARVREARPQLVCLGPVYKAYNVTVRENDELAAGELMAFLDKMRTRYQFTLILEHHAPKAQGGKRDILPYGSSRWLRWPDLGVKLVPTKNMKDSLTVSRWRADRPGKLGWPDRLDRGKLGEWPWVGYWEHPPEVGGPTSALEF